MAINYPILEGDFLWILITRNVGDIFHKYLDAKFLDRQLYYTLLFFYHVFIIWFLAVISDRLAPCIVRFDRHGHDCGIMSITIKYVHAKKRDESPNYDMAISII